MSDGTATALGGLAAERCCEALRARGYEGALQMVCAEPVRLYNRPPFSNQVLFGERETGGARATSRPLGTPSTTSSRASAWGPCARTVRARVLTVGGGRRLALRPPARGHGCPLLAGFAPSEGLENILTLRAATDGGRASICLRSPVPGSRSWAPGSPPSRSRRRRGDSAPR